MINGQINNHSETEFICGTIPQIREPHANFDFAEVDRNVFGVPDSDLDGLKSLFAKGLKEIVKWINKGDGATARAVRALGIEFHLTGTTQAKLGRENGITRAAVSKAANDFRDTFKIDSILNGNQHMRTAEFRERRSKQCKQEHKRRKSKKASKHLQTYVASLSP